MFLTLEGAETETRIRAEWDRLRTVAMHRPGMEMFFGLLEPYASLYERTFNQNGAIQEHRRLEHVLRHEFQVKVIKLRNAITQAAERKPEVRDNLMQAAYSLLELIGSEVDVKQARAELDKNMDVLDPSHFFEILLLTPQVELESERGTRMIHLNITEKQPLSNIFFMRDQQAVTDKGILLSRMSKPQRRREPFVTKLLWDVLGAEVVHEVTEPGTFEGGDFIPMKDFALVGVGDRTNESGIEQILKHAVDFDEIGVVHQPNHPLIPNDEVDPMIDMHLDTYFNIASSGVAVGLGILLERAKVDIYNRVGPGAYEREDESTDLFSYITGWGFDVIDITTLEQLSYASNFLTIKDGTILAVEVEQDIKDVLSNLQGKAKAEPGRYGALLSQAEKDYEFLKDNSEFFPHKRGIYQHGIDAYPMVLKNLTGGYGAAHCMTAALERR
jgi:arginine deiminase